MPYYPAHDMHLPYVCAAIRPLLTGQNTAATRVRTENYTTIRLGIPPLYAAVRLPFLFYPGHRARILSGNHAGSPFHVFESQDVWPFAHVDHRSRSLAGLTWSISSPCPRHRNRDPGCHSTHTSDFRLIDIYTGFDVRDFHHRLVFLSVIACRLPKLPVKSAKSHRL